MLFRSTDATRKAKEASVAAEQAVAIAENNLALQKAALQLQTDKAAAEAAGAKPLAEAKTQQNIVIEQEITAQKTASLRKAQLTSEVNAVADADAYKVKVEAQAAADAAVAKAKGDRDAHLLNAEAVRAEGEAAAFAILARGTAEAEATKLSAAAVAEQSDALVKLRIIESLPLIAHELAAPLGNIDQLTVISTDGASQLTRNVASGFGEIDGVLQSTIGTDIRSLLGNFINGTAAGRANAHATESVPASAAAVDGEPATVSAAVPVLPLEPSIS